MDRAARFWDRHAAGYAKRPIDDQAAYERKLEITRQYFRPDMEVLEFGCGTGSTAILHAPFVKHIQAIDISSGMVEIARNKGAPENVNFEQATIEELSVPDGSFDAVLGMSILHLLENKEEVIGKIHRLLKPGGIFVSSTVCLGDTMKFFKLIGPIGKFLGLMPLLRVFKAADLVTSITEGGFTIEEQWQPKKGSAVFIVAKKA